MSRTKKSDREKDRETDKLITETEDYLASEQNHSIDAILRRARKQRSWWAKVKKGIDFSNALRYIGLIANLTPKRKKAMEQTTTPKTTKKSAKKNTVNWRAIFGAVIASPFIVQGVASLVETDMPYLNYGLGALIAGFIVNMIVNR